jgi:multiple sugar transport system permease protein
MRAEAEVLSGVIRRPGYGEIFQRFMRRLWQYRASYLMLTPFGIGFFLFTILPVLAAIALSLTYYDVLQPPQWVGLQNFKTLFLYDNVFIIAVRNTLIYGIITGPIGLLLSFFFAWIINRVRLSWRVPLTLALYAPSLQSGITVGLIAGYFLSTDQYGLFNYALMRLGIIHQPMTWLTNPKLIMPTLIGITLWMSMGTGFLIFLSGLQTIKPELYEAARVDGVRSAWQELFYITMPQMKPYLLMNGILAVVASFGGSGLLGLAGGVNSPDYAALAISDYAADYASTRFMMGYAAAIAVIMFVWSYGLGRLLQNWLTEK